MFLSLNAGSKFHRKRATNATATGFVCFATGLVFYSNPFLASLVFFGVIGLQLAFQKKVISVLSLHSLSQRERNAVWIQACLQYSFALIVCCLQRLVWTLPECLFPGYKCLQFMLKMSMYEFSVYTNVTRLIYRNMG